MQPRCLIVGFILSLFALCSASLTMATDDTPTEGSSAAHCHDGFAGSHACSRINLLSHISVQQFNSGSASDIWGWVDPLDNHEYVIIGHFNGTSFVDVTEPQAPALKGFLPAHEDIVGGGSGGVQKSCAASTVGKTSNPAIAHDDDSECSEGEGSTWRDIKVFQNHAFIVSESTGHGMQVFDLTRLRNAHSSTVFTEDAHHAGFGSAHNIAINEASARAYAVGSRQHAGGLYILDISNPTMPRKIGSYASDGYTHDTQCVTYQGPDTRYSGRELCFSSNEDSIGIADVTNSSSIQRVGIGTYPNASYIHQGWLSEDHRYFYQNDETDERDGLVARTSTYVWDLVNLENPSLANVYEGTISAIDHNNYVMGDYVFQSNYTTGLRVLSRKNPTELLEIAYFDTYTPNDQTNFSGTWSNYPYFPSGIIVVSDKDTGLYVLEPMFMDTGLELADIDVRVSTATKLDENSLSVSFSYVATVTNNSAVVAEDVTATHILEAGSTIQGIESTALCSVRENFIDCRIGAMQPNEQVQFEISSSVSASIRVPYETQATAMNVDSNEANNKASGNATFSSSAVNPPSPPASGSGGGGATNFWLLCLILLWTKSTARTNVTGSIRVRL